jgi:hypothetical protein
METRRMSIFSDLRALVYARRQAIAVEGIQRDFAEWLAIERSRRESETRVARTPAPVEISVLNVEEAEKEWRLANGIDEEEYER